MKYILTTIVFLLFTLNAHSASSDPGVLYWKSYDDSDELFVYVPNVDKSVPILKLQQRPEHLFFDDDGKYLFYIEDNMLYRMDWKVGSVPAPIIQFPDIVFNYIDIWRDKKSNKWRIRFVDYVDSEGKIIEKEVNGTKKRYLKYDGALVLLDKHKKYIDSDRRVKYIAVVKEYDPKTGWTALFREITSCFDHSTPCLSMTDDMIDTNVRSFATLRHDLFYSEKFDALSVESDSNDFVFFKTVPDMGKLIKTTLSPAGHTYEFFPPIALITEKSGQEIVLEKPRSNSKPWEYIGFKQNGPYLLVARTFNAKNGYVVDLVSGKIIFRAPKQSPVCWVSAPQF